MISTRTVYVTDDQKEHSTEAEAQEWEFRCNLVSTIDRDTTVRSADAEELIDWLLQRYTLVPK